MDAEQASNAVFYGLKFSEWLTLIGIVIGPIAAVLITLWVDGRRRKREQQAQVMRLLLNSRHLPSDPSYTIAINSIPVEFNSSKRVMGAWHSYIDCVRYKATTENAAASYEDVRAKQTKLIFEVMRSLGYKLAETDIQNSAYAAGGFIDRDNVFMEAWRAWPRIANALELQVGLTSVADDEGKK